MSAQMDFDFAADAKRDIERFAVLARNLASVAGRAGITVANVRHTAENRGLLTGEERGRRLSFLGAVMRAAGLVETDEFRRSDIPRSHGNLHRVWILPEYARERAS